MPVYEDKQKNEARPDVETANKSRMNSGGMSFPGMAQPFPGGEPNSSRATSTAVAPKNIFLQTGHARFHSGPLPQGAVINTQPRPFDASLLRTLQHSTKDAPGTAGSSGVMLSMLKELAQQVIWDVVQEMLSCVLTLDYRKSYQGLREFYQEITTIYASNDKLEVKFSRLTDAIDVHSRSLPEQIGGWRVRPYLLTTAKWLREISAGWQSGDVFIQNVKNETTYLGQLALFLNATVSVLQNTHVIAVLGKETSSRLHQSVHLISSLFTQIHVLRSRPGGMQWEDYLSLLTAQEDHLPASLIQLLKLGKHLAKIQGVNPYPEEASLTTRLTWIMETLSDPQTLKNATPLLGQNTVSYLEQTLGFGKNALQFPTEGGLHGQTLWLFEQISRIPGIGNTSVTLFLNSLRHTLGGEQESLKLFGLLMKLADPQASKMELIIKISQHVGRPLIREYGPSLAVNLAKTHLPAWVADPVDFLRRFIKGVKPDEKWVNVADRLTESVLAAAPGALVKYASSDPLALTTSHLASAIVKHTTFSESLLYIVTQAKGDSEDARAIYWLYISGMLSWRTYQALHADDMKECEARLRELVREMKDTHIVAVFPQLEKLLDLLPLIPVLRTVKQRVQQEQGGKSWLQQVDSIIEALSGSSSPTLQELKRTLTVHYSHWIAQTLKSGLYGMLGTAQRAEESAPDTGGMPAGVMKNEHSLASSVSASWGSTGRTGRKLLSVEDVQADSSAKDRAVPRHFTMARQNSEDEKEDVIENDDDWDMDALVDASQDDLELDSTDTWHQWARAGGAASAGIGLLALIASIWRAHQRRQTRDTQSPQESGEDIPLVHVQPQIKDENAPLTISRGVYNSTVNEIPAYEIAHRQSSMWLDKGLPLVALTLGIALPAGLLFAANSRDALEIDALTIEDINRIVRSLPAESVRQKRSAGPTKKTYAIAARKYMQHIISKIPEAYVPAATQWLRKTVASILKSSGASLTARQLSISLDKALAIWFVEHQSASGTSEDIAVMSALSSAIFIDLATHSDNPLIQRHLEKTRTGTAHQAQMRKIFNYLYQLKTGFVLSKEDRKEFLDLLIKERRDLKENNEKKSDYHVAHYITMWEFIREFSRLKSGGESDSFLTAYVMEITVQLTELKKRYDDLASVITTTTAPDVSFENSFSPMTQTPDEFIRKWISKEMRKSGMEKDYQNDQISLNYKLYRLGKFRPGRGGSHETQIIDKNETISIEELVSKQWKRRELNEGWGELKIDWPESYPQELRDVLLGNHLWTDFKSILNNYVTSDNGKLLEKRIASLMRGRVMRAGVYQGDFNDFDKKVKSVRVYAGKQMNVSNLFEFEGYVYSITSALCVKSQLYSKSLNNRVLKQEILLGLSGTNVEYLGDNALDGMFQVPVAGDFYQSVSPFLIFDDCPEGGSKKLISIMLNNFDDLMDRAIRDKNEMDFDRVIHFVKMGMMAVSMILSPFLKIPGAILLSLVTSVPDFVAVSNADTLEEEKELIKLAMMGVLSDMGFELTPNLGKVSKYAKKKLGTKIDNYFNANKRAPVIKMEEIEDWTEKTIRLFKSKTFKTSEVDEILDRQTDKLLKKLTRPANERIPQIIASVKSELASSQGMENMLETPSEYGIQAARMTFSHAQQHGLQPEIVQTLYWGHAMDENPVNHFAVRVNNNGRAYIIDPTLTRFEMSELKTGDIYVGPETEWISHLKNAHRNKMIKMVSSKSSDFLSSILSKEAMLVSGEIISEASWYRLSQTQASLAVHVKMDVMRSKVVKENRIIDAQFSHPQFKKRFSKLMEAITKNEDPNTGLTTFSLESISNRPDLKKKVLDSVDLDGLGNKPVDEQLSVLKSLSNNIDSTLQDISQEAESQLQNSHKVRNASVNRINSLLTLKINVEIRKLKLEIDKTRVHSSGENAYASLHLDYRNPPVDQVPMNLIDLPWRSINLVPTPSKWNVNDYLDVDTLQKEIDGFMNKLGVTPPDRSLKVEILSQKEMVEAIKLDRPGMTIGYDKDTPGDWVSGYTTGREGKVLLSWDHPDFSIKDGGADELARRSTLIHEAVHSRSKNSKGFQELAVKNPSKWYDSNINIDEIVTDYIAYHVAKNLGFDYVSAYSARGLDGEINKIWIGNFMSYLKENNIPIDKVMSSYFSDPNLLDTDPALNISDSLRDNWKKFTKQMRRTNLKTGLDIPIKPLLVAGHKDARPGGTHDVLSFKRPDKKDYQNDVEYTKANQEYEHEIQRFMEPGVNELKAKPVEPNPNKYNTLKAYEHAVARHQSDIAIWRQAGEEVKIISTVNYGASTSKMNVMSDESLSTGYLDIEQFRLIAGFNKGNPPASSKVNTLVALAHGHSDGDNPGLGVVPKGISVHYPVPYGMIAAIAPAEKLAAKMSSFTAHSVVGTHIRGGYQFNENKLSTPLRTIKHTMQDRPFDALGTHEIKNDNVLVQKQYFNRFEDDTTLSLVRAVKSNRKEDHLPVDFLTVREGMSKDIPQTELFRAVEKINVSRTEKYNNVIVLACRQVKFEDEADLKSFLTDMFKMDAADVELISRHNMLDDLQAYNPMGENKPFRGMNTGRRDKRETGSARLQPVLQLVTLQRYHPDGSPSSAEIIAGCLAGDRIIMLDTARDRVMTLSRADASQKTA